MSKSFEILGRESLYEGFLRLERYRLRHQSYQGGMSLEIVREQLAGLSAVSVLPYDPVTDQVVLIEQFRIGVLEDPDGPWILEPIGGYKPDGESAEAVARREGLEEAGIELGRLEEIGSFYVSPGLSSELIRLYCAEVDASAAGGIHGLPEEGEETRVVVMPAEEAISELFRGIRSTSAIICLQWLAANRQRLHGAWL